MRCESTTCSLRGGNANGYEDTDSSSVPISGFDIPSSVAQQRRCIIWLCVASHMRAFYLAGTAGGIDEVELMKADGCAG